MSSGNDLDLIIPLHEPGDQLPEALMDIIQQVRGEPDVSIVVVDDGCSPSVGELLRAQAMESANLLLAQTSHNSGPGAARNVGLGFSTAPYVAFVDADDDPKIDRYLAMVRLAKETHSDVVIGGFQVMAEDGSLLATSLPTSEASEKGILALMSHRIGVWRCVVRRDFLREHDVSFEPLSYGEDLVWALRTNSRRPRTRAFPETVYTYRWNSASQLSARRIPNSGRQLVLRSVRQTMADSDDRDVQLFCATWMCRIALRGLREGDLRSGLSLAAALPVCLQHPSLIWHLVSDWRGQGLSSSRFTHPER